MQGRNRLLRDYIHGRGAANGEERGEVARCRMVLGTRSLGYARDRARRRAVGAAHFYYALRHVLGIPVM
jgi:hypothetical protein